jgi:hypothetical protein
MATASLPELPKGKEFEEFLAAFLQTHGLYVERNVVDRQETEILELDIITTDYQKDAVPENRIVEVKGGDWGASDIFKIRGWLDYLRSKAGILLVSKAHDHFESHQRIGEQLSVALVNVAPSLADARKQLSPILGEGDADLRDITIWRFAYWTERQLLRMLTVKKKSVQGKKCYQALDSYLTLINSRLFFTDNVVRRAKGLYDAFAENAHISAKLGHELDGRAFDEDHQKVPEPLFKEAYYKCRLNDLALSTYVEHRARLAVLKAATDYVLYKRAGKDHNEEFKFRIEEFEIELGGKLLDLVPKSFREGLETLAKAPSFHRYPVFWQWFLWVFGGFLLKDFQNEEYELLSKVTGMPVEHISDALKAFDILFPRDGGWFVEPKNTNVRVMIMAPMPFMGVGANLRRIRYAENGQFAKLKVTGAYTLNDLMKWNNVLVELLTKTF